MRMRASAMAKLIVPAMRYAVIRWRLRKDAGAPASVSVQRVSRMIAARTTPQVAAISIADCVAPYRGKSTMPERRYQTDPTVLNTANTAHQYAANLARHANAMIMPSTAPPMAIEAKTNGCSWQPPG